MTRIATNDLVQVVESSHPSLRGKQVRVDGIIVRHVSDSGTTRGTVEAVEAVASARQVGEVVTVEPPIGSTVRIERAYYRRGTDGQWYDQGDMHRYSWAQLRTLAELNETGIVFISETEARQPVFVVGEVVTEEMGEPPVGSVVTDRDGDRWTRRATWSSAASGLTGWTSAKGYGPLTLASLPDQPTEEPKPSAMAEPEDVGAVVEVAYPAGTRLWWTRIHTQTGGAPWGSPGYMPRHWPGVAHGAVSVKVVVDDSLAPLPEVREVALSEAKAGDAVILRGIVSGVDDDGEVFVEVPGSESEDFRFYPHDMPAGALTITRKPLPTTPGTVGTATVRGVPNVEVMRIWPTESGRCWQSRTEVGSGLFHYEDQVHDFVPDGGEDR